MPPIKTTNDVVELIRTHNDIISEILAVFDNYNTDPSVAEQILLYMAGCSAGVRQAPITGDWINTAALSWKLAANETD